MSKVFGVDLDLNVSIASTSRQNQIKYVTGNMICVFSTCVVEHKLVLPNAQEEQAWFCANVVTLKNMAKYTPHN